MGTESRIEELRPRVISTLFCYGCNLGPTQTARSIRGMSRKQIAWLNIKYVTEEVLEKAIVKVINAYNKFELPGYWGSGKHASADGTKWNLYEQNLISEHHIRYGGYGGIGYYHVSDKFIGKRRPTPVLTPQTFSLSRRSFTADKSKCPGSKSSPHHARIS